MKNMFHDQLPPARIIRSPSARRRVDIRTRANAMSAVASVSTPGVLVKVTPRSIIAGTSALSYPTATLATTASWSPAASRNAASTRS